MNKTLFIALMFLAFQGISAQEKQVGQITQGFQMGTTSVACDNPPEVTAAPTQELCPGASTLLSPNITLPGSSVNGFSGDFAAANWGITSNNSDGSITISPTSMVMVSSNNQNIGSNSGFHMASITIPANGVLSFDWDYTTVDGAPYDYPQLSINGAISLFTGYVNSNFGSNTQNGSVSINVVAGDVIGLRIFSTDNRFGAATTTVNNFEFTDANPLTFSYSWSAFNGGVINGADDEPTLNVDTFGTYSLTVSSGASCSTTITIQVIDAQPVISSVPSKFYFLENQTISDIGAYGPNIVWYDAPVGGNVLPLSTQLINGTTYYVTDTTSPCVNNSASVIATACIVSSLISSNPTEELCPGNNILLNPTVPLPTINGFTNQLSPQSWNVTSNNSNGSVLIDANTMTIVSGNNGSSSQGTNSTTVTMPLMGQLIFDWVYNTQDADGSAYDYPQYSLNGQLFTLTGFILGGPSLQTGSFILSVQQGDVLTLLMKTADNIGGSATITITDFVLSSPYNFTYSWTASNGGTINGANNQSTLLVDTTGTYTLTASLSSNCVTTVQIEVLNAQPSVPIVPTQFLFFSGQMIQDVNVQGSNISWFDAALGGNPLSVSTPLTDGAIFYVSQYLNGCESDRLPVLFVLCDVDDIISISPTQTICSGQSINLSPTISPSLVLYNGFTDNFVSDNWTVISTNSNGSSSINSSTMTLSLHGAPLSFEDANYGVFLTMPSSGSISFDWSFTSFGVASDNYPVFTVNYSNYVLSGYEFDTGIIPNTQTGTFTIHASQGDVIGINIRTNFSFISTLNITNFTFSTAETLSYAWTASDGGVINGAPNNASLEVDTAGTYTLTVTNGDGCSSSESIEVIVNTTPAAPTAAPVQYFSNGQTLADISVTGSNLTWYDDAAAGNILPTSTLLVDGVTYYVSQTVNGCESARVSVTASLLTATISAANCNTTILNTQLERIYATEITGATQWIFRIDNGTQAFEVTRNVNFVHFFDFMPNISYGITYQVSVSALVDGVSTGFGPSCPISITGAPKTSLAPAFCNVNLPSINTNMSLRAVDLAMGYRIHVKNMTSGVTQTIVKMGNTSESRRVRISDFSNAALGTTFKVWAEITLDGTNFIPVAETDPEVCEVTTPAPVIPTTQMSRCGTTLPGANVNLTAVWVSDLVQEWNYVIVDNQNNTLSEVTKTTNGVLLSEFPSITFASGTPYLIKVRVKMFNTWGAFGNTCTISTVGIGPNAILPTTQLQASRCNTVIPGINVLLRAAWVSDQVTSHTFALVNENQVIISEVEKPNNDLRLSDFPGLTVELGTVYRIRVKVQINNVWGNYGGVCTVTTPGGSSTVSRANAMLDNSFKTYPNPFHTQTTVSWTKMEATQAHISVYDVTGKMIQTLTTNESSIQLGQEYTAGVYFVTIVDGEQQFQTKIVKK